MDQTQPLFTARFASYVGGGGRVWWGFL